MNSNIMKIDINHFSNQSDCMDFPLISTDFELSENNNLKFVDPYDSIWLKLTTVGIYAIEIWSAMVKMAFVTFETRGLAGHYRTLINQLLSYLYGAVSTHCKYFDCQKCRF